MAKIQTLDNKYFIIRYDDGIIVSFIKTNDSLMDTTDEVSYANQIHRIVSNNIQNILFASDVVGQISCPEDLKEKISKNLFVYSKKGVSVSGSNIHLIHSKKKIEIINDGDLVLTIKKRRKLGFWKRLFQLYILLYFIIMLIALLSIIKEEYIDNQEITPDYQDNTNKSSYEIDRDVNDNMSSKSHSDNTQVLDINDVSDTIGDLDDANNDTEAADVMYIQNTGHIIEPQQRQSEDANSARTVTTAAETTSETEILAMEANEHLRIAEEAYKKYVINLEKDDGIMALTHFNKALQLCEYLPDKKKSIVEHIETLNKVFN